MVLPCPGSPSCPCWKNFLFYFFLAICMMLLLFTCYWIMKRHLSLPRTRRRLPSGNNSDEPSTQLQSRGLASAVIRSLPAIRFRKGMEEGHGSNDCAICLGKFHEGEWLRVLPNCDHVFHVYCIDPWLRSHSTCPLCRTNVLYDFNHPNSSVSSVVSLGTLQREDAHQERALADRLLQSELMRNLESGMGAMSGRPYETESDESFQGWVSPVERPSNQRRTVEELLKIAHNDNGESSSRGLGFNNEYHTYAQRPLA